MQIFEDEERKMRGDIQHDISLAMAIHNMWDSKGVWFWHCIESV